MGPVLEFSASSTVSEKLLLQGLFPQIGKWSSLYRQRKCKGHLGHLAFSRSAHTFLSYFSAFHFFPTSAFTLVQTLGELFHSVTLTISPRIGPQSYTPKAFFFKAYVKTFGSSMCVLYWMSIALNITFALHMPLQDNNKKPDDYTIFIITLLLW